MSRVGLVIMELREERGWSKGQLSTYSGVSDSYISQIESGKRLMPSGRILEKLANALGVTVDYILARADGRPFSEDDTFIEKSTHLLRQLPDYKRPEVLEYLRIAVEYSQPRPGLLHLVAEEQADHDVQREIDELWERMKDLPDEYKQKLLDFMLDEVKTA